MTKFETQFHKEDVNEKLDAKLEILNCILNSDFDVRNATIDGEKAEDLAAQASDPSWLAAFKSENF